MLSFTKNRDQLQIRQVCLTTPIFALGALTARILSVPPRDGCCIAEMIAVIQAMLGRS